MIGVFGDFPELLELGDALANGLEVGEQPTEPAVVHVERLHPCRFGGDDLLRLALGADEEDRLAFGSEPGNEIESIPEERQGLVEIHDVDPTPRPVDVRPHARVPPLGFVAEMEARFQQVPHAYGRGHRIDYWGINYRRMTASGGSEAEDEPSSALGVLEAFPGSGLPVFLTLLAPRVPGEETPALEFGTELCVVVAQCARNTEADCSRLS